jgi:RNA polymerase sigma-70 factor (ECF subfamily)
VASDGGNLGRPFALDDIRAETAWLRRLAAALVRGEGVRGAGAEADDVAQEAWLAGLTHPPARADSVRAWLRVVVTNVVRKQRRGTTRRHARESGLATTNAAVLPAVPDAAELAERLESQRLVADLVLGLEEPLRSTILLCYYEDFSPAQIAAQQGVPAGTVRWRLKQARDRLRAQLQARHAGPRSWRALLLPLAPAAHARASTKGTKGLWTAMAINSGGKVAIGGALALLVLLLAVARWRPSPARLAAGTAAGAAADVAAARAVPLARRDNVAGAEVIPGTAAGRSARVHVPRFVVSPRAGTEAMPAALVTGTGRKLAMDDGHITDRSAGPDGGGVGAARLAQIEAKLDLVHERANQCLVGWQRLDPALATGVMLGLKVDEQGLEDVWIEGQPAIPDGPLRCLSSAAYEIDWSGLTTAPAMVTLPLRYEAGDAGAAGTNQGRLP